MAGLPHLAELEALLKRNRNHPDGPLNLPPEEPRDHPFPIEESNSWRLYLHHKESIKFHANKVLQTNPSQFEEEYAFLKEKEVYLTGAVERLVSDSSWKNREKIRTSYFTPKSTRAPLNAKVAELRKRIGILKPIRDDVRTNLKVYQEIKDTLNTSTPLGSVGGAGRPPPAPSVPVYSASHPTAQSFGTTKTPTASIVSSEPKPPSRKRKSTRKQRKSSRVRLSRRRV